MPLNCVDVHEELGFVEMEMPIISVLKKYFLHSGETVNLVPLTLGLPSIFTWQEVSLC